MQEDLVVSVAFACHHGSADLAKPDTMSPTRTIQNKSVPIPFYIKGRTLEMGVREPATDDQFLADDNGLPVAYYLEPFQSSGWSLSIGTRARIVRNPF